MTTALGPILTSNAPIAGVTEDSAPASAPATPAKDFARLLERFVRAMREGSADRPAALVGLAALGVKQPSPAPGMALPEGEAPPLAEAPLGEVVEEGLDLLATLLDASGNDAGPDPDAALAVEDVLDRVEAALAAETSPDAAPGATASERSLPTAETAAPRPLPAALAELLDRLTALATRLTPALEEGAPDISARLTALARRLDLQTGLSAAAAEPDAPTPPMLMRLAQAEVKPDAAAAIAKAAGEPDAASDVPVPPRQGGKAALLHSMPAQTPAPAKAAPSPACPAPEPLPPASSSPAIELTKTLDQMLAPSAAQPLQVTGLKAGAVAYIRPEPQINLPHIAVEIARHLQGGINRFEIRLNPPELGRIDVRMEMDQSGNVVARLAVEKIETLDLLQRDQRALERALMQAGLDSEKTSLEFSLKRDGDGRPGPWAPDPETSPRAAGLPASPSPEPGSGETVHRGYARADAVDLRV